MFVVGIRYLTPTGMCIGNISTRDASKVFFGGGGFPCLRTPARWNKQERDSIATANENSLIFIREVKRFRKLAGRPSRPRTERDEDKTQPNVSSSRNKSGWRANSNERHARR